jgi:hypothetical protein
MCVQRFKSATLLIRWQGCRTHWSQQCRRVGELALAFHHLRPVLIPVRHLDDFRNARPSLQGASELVSDIGLPTNYVLIILGCSLPRKFSWQSIDCHLKRGCILDFSSGKISNVGIKLGTSMRVGVIACLAEAHNILVALFFLFVAQLSQSSGSS